MFARLLRERPKAKARAAYSKEAGFGPSPLAKAGYDFATRPGGGNSTELETEADRIADNVVQNTTPGPGIERLRPAFGYDLSHIRLHADESAARQASARGARAFTRGNDIFFSRGALKPETPWGMRLLAHEIAHTFQQADGKVPAGTIQNEDWDFTPADYAKQVKQGKLLADSILAGAFDLTFDADSAWFPNALQENLITTLKFVLTAKNPARTAGVNAKDFYHGHFVIPLNKGKLTKLEIKVGDFKRKREQLEFEALQGKKYEPNKPTGDVTQKNLPAYTQAIQQIEKLATPVLEEALEVPGAAVMYHTFEENRPKGMEAIDPIRNIITPIGGTPKGYVYSGKGADDCPYKDTPERYLCEYERILDFAFLVDQQGIVHVRPDSAPRVLSTVTGRPE